VIVGVTRAEIVQRLKGDLLEQSAGDFQGFVEQLEGEIRWADAGWYLQPFDIVYTTTRNSLI
jgi:hypothetical protein